jgi:hypothetical protein
MRAPAAAGDQGQLAQRKSSAPTKRGRGVGTLTGYGLTGIIPSVILCEHMVAESKAVEDPDCESGHREFESPRSPSEVRCDIVKR